MTARRPATALRRVIPGACICGGAFLLEQRTFEGIDAVRAHVRGQGTTLAYLVPEDLPVRLDSYRCEQGCAAGGAERLVNVRGDAFHWYGRPGVRVW